MRGRWWRAEAHWICPMRHGILWWNRIHNWHLRINSPQGNKDGTTSSFSLTTVTSVIGLPSSGLACQVHRLHLKLGSGFRGQEVPLHFFWIQLEQPPQKREFVLIPMRYTPQWSLLDLCTSDIRTLVLPMVTRSPFPSMLVFLMISFSCSSSSVSVMVSRSSACRFSQGHPIRNSLEWAFRTVMNHRGLRQEPWWTLTFTLNFLLGLHPARTLLLAFSYMLCMSCTRYSSALSSRRAHQMTRLGAWSDAFSRST